MPFSLSLADSVSSSRRRRLRKQSASMTPIKTKPAIEPDNPPMMVAFFASIDGPLTPVAVGDEVDIGSWVCSDFVRVGEPIDGLCATTAGKVVEDSLLQSVVDRSVLGIAEGEAIPGSWDVGKDKVEHGVVTPDGVCSNPVVI